MAIKRRLTFVVGAGASYELGFPTGRGLLEQIANLARLSGGRNEPILFDPNDRQVMVNHPKLADFFLRGSQYLSSVEEAKSNAYWIASNCALAPSIDNLLHTHQHNSELVLLGKAMICCALIDAEKKSCLMPEKASITKEFLQKTVNEKSAPKSWLGQLFWLLAEGNTFKDFLESLVNIGFVSFNYDRSIQHFLVNAATSYFRLIEEEQIQSVSDSINVVFPYGSLGSLHVNKHGVSGFGQSEIASSFRNIKTFTEGLNDPDDQNRISTMVSNCDELIFLGFGFHDMNIKIIFDGIQSTSLKVSGTRLGLSPRNYEAVSSKLRDALQPRHKKKEYFGIVEMISLQDLTCADFFAANSLALRS